MTVPERIAWQETYYQLQNAGEEYYFDNENGFKRCLEEAQQEVPRAEKAWALYMKIRMQT